MAGKTLKSKTPNHPAGIFQIGSVTKQFTAAIILKLQEQGKLTVNDPINNYIHNFPNGDKITFVKDNNGKVTSLKGAREGWYLTWKKID